MLIYSCVKVHATSSSSLAAERTGLGASRLANVDAIAATGEMGPAAEGEQDQSSVALALVRKPLAACSSLTPPTLPDPAHIRP